MPVPPDVTLMRESPQPRRRDLLGLLGATIASASLNADAVRAQTPLQSAIQGVQGEG